MPSLKDLKTRIGSVKSTRKITSAMKMVAAAKLRRAQEAAEAARPFAGRMEAMVESVAGSMRGCDGGPRMLTGDGRDKVHLLVAFAADRGLCGGFNASIVKAVRLKARELEDAGKTVKIFCVGKKGADALKREMNDKIIDFATFAGRKRITYADAADIGSKISTMFEEGLFDVCAIFFNRFQSAMTQVVTPRRLIPLLGHDTANEDGTLVDASKASHIFEPEEDEILAKLLPLNINTQIFQALLESAASEHGARMTAMDSATRNAGDMIDNLTLTYNRTRQACITKELIEIISGAEAL